MAGDTDTEDGVPDPATVKIVNPDNAAGKLKTVAGEGVWSVDAVTGAITFTPAQDYDGPVTQITYTIADSEGLRSLPASVSVTITAVNDAPVAVDDIASVAEGGAVIIDVLANDTDVEDGTPDPATVELDDADDSAGKLKTVAGEGVWSVDVVTGAITFTPQAGYSGAITPAVYTVADSEGLRSAPAAVNVTITSGPSLTILEENQKQGTPQDVWDAPISDQIEGFATDISYDTGDLVSFKINLNTAQSAPYRIEIYRLGYYDGDGATLVTTLDNLTGSAQPDPITDARGLVDAGNWSVSATWQSPQDAVSGVYLARLVREDNGGENQIPFILREDDPRPDGTKSDIVFQTADTSWHAYNGWAGRNGVVGGNFYGGFDQPDGYTDDPGLNYDRAFAVSYNRPFLTRDAGGAAAGAQDYLFGAEYAAIYWLEQNGYDVSYISGVDTDRLGPDALLGHKAYLSVGHDEYWSGGQRANVEAARDAGVNLLFWAGNEVYWKARYEASIDGSNTDYRTLVSYKETWNNFFGTAPEDYADVDPSEQWTGTWRDLRFADAVDGQGNPTAVGAKPENSLTGQLFAPDGNSYGEALDIPEEFAGLRVWRDTTFAGIGALNLAEGIIGYEWNVSPEDEYRPASLIKLSETTAFWPRILVDEGNRVAPGTATHNLTLYRAESGALVFGAGTVFWTWALSDRHDSSPYGATIENTDLQQFTVNMFADMGIQPAIADAILASRGLVRASASSDVVAATTTVNDLPDTISSFAPIVITGTASDVGGVVGVVEVSLDGGSSWRVADGKGDWSYSWFPTTSGTFEIVARAIDDSLNIPSIASLPTQTVEVTAPPLPSAFSLFDPYESVTGNLNTDGPWETGLRFSAAQDGFVTELKYWRAPGDAGDTDVREGSLWSQNGILLASAFFDSGPGESGWQVVELDTPVQIVAAIEYVVSYHTDDNYHSAPLFFEQQFIDPFGILTGIGSVYAGGNNVVFPTQTYNGENYWVDVSFVPGEIQPEGVAAAVGGFTSADEMYTAPDQKKVGRVVAIDPDGDTFRYSLAQGRDKAFFSIDPDTGELSFKEFPGKGRAEFPGKGPQGKVLPDDLYSLRIRASDGIDDTFEQDLTIRVGGDRYHAPPGWANHPEAGPPDFVELPWVDEFQF